MRFWRWNCFLLTLGSRDMTESEWIRNLTRVLRSNTCRRFSMGIPVVALTTWVRSGFASFPGCCFWRGNALCISQYQCRLAVGELRRLPGRLRPLNLGRPLCCWSMPEAAAWLSIACPTRGISWAMLSWSATNSLGIWTLFAGEIHRYEECGWCVLRVRVRGKRKAPTKLTCLRISLIRRN